MGEVGSNWKKGKRFCLGGEVACTEPIPNPLAAESLRELFSAIAQEGIAVTTSLGVTLEKNPEDMIDDSIPVAYLHKPSMLQDVEAQRVTEIDSINGGVATIGEKIGVPCPINRAIADMVKGLEHSWTLEA